MSEGQLTVITPFLLPLIAQLIHAGYCMEGCNHEVVIVTGEGMGRNFAELLKILDHPDLDGVVDSVDFQEGNGAIFIRLVPYDGITNSLLYHYSTCL